MITLKYLHVERFKGLQTVDLHFPEKGGILVEGHNEAGKSTLFEALYVALYGAPLVGEEHRPRIEEVVQHGAATAVVDLTLCVQSSELRIHREIHRGKQPRVRVTTTPADGKSETVHTITAANKRILHEIGGLDGESLRNSCFVEQAALGRLEDLGRGEREKVMEKLLGLERFTYLDKRFRFAAEQGRSLQQARQMRDLACLNEKLAALRQTRQETAERLDAIETLRLIAAADAASCSLRAAQQSIREDEAREAELQASIDRYDALRVLHGKATTLQAACQQVNQIRERLAEKQQELDALTLLETQTIPALEKRFAQSTAILAAVNRAVKAAAAVRAAEARVESGRSRLTELTRVQTTHHNALQAVATAEEREAQRRRALEESLRQSDAEIASLAGQRVRLGGVRDAAVAYDAAQAALASLVEAVKGSDARAQDLVDARTAREDAARAYEEARVAAKTADNAATAARCRAAAKEREAAEAATRCTALETWCEIARAMGETTARQQACETVNCELAEAQVLEAAARHAARSRRLGSAGAAAAGILFLAAGLALTPASAIPGVLLLVAAVVLFTQVRSRDAAVKEAETRRSDLQARVHALTVEAQAAAMVAGSTTLAEQEAALARLGLSAPSSLEQCEAELARMRQAVNHTAAVTAPNVSDLVQEAGRLGGRAQAAKDRLARAQEDERAATATVAADNRLDLLERCERARAAAQAAGDSAQNVGDGLLAWPFTTRDVDAKIEMQDQLIATAERRRAEAETQGQAHIAEAERDVAAARGALEAAASALVTAHDAVTAEPFGAAQTALVEAQALAAQVTNDAASLAAAHGLPADEAGIVSERGKIEERLDTHRHALDTRPDLETSAAALRSALAKGLTELDAGVSALRAEMAPLAIEAETDEMSPGASIPHEEAAAAVIATLLRCIADALAPLDIDQLRARQHDVSNQIALQRSAAATYAGNLREACQDIQRILDARGLTLPAGASRLEAVYAAWPLTLAVQLRDLDAQQELLEQTDRQIYADEQQRGRLCLELGQPDVVPSSAECRLRVDELEQQQAVCNRAQQIVSEARGRIMRSVLPTTENNMSQLLPQLTAQRYWDVRLTPAEGDASGAGDLDYRIRVWDPDAQRYLAKNIFSGGTRDQFSLALRLSFALATLPQERGVAPGFIFLDEPLSAFDARRARDLVALLTTGTIGQQFAQVIVVSHANAFDRGAFPYHVVMEGGKVRESNLPTVDAELPS